ncbi:MAG: SRPBCC family protein [Candidatus Methylomirabilales bacterium]
MSLRIEKKVTVNARVERVWEFLTDLPRVARCLPGAEVTRQIDERSYGATITIKVGLVSARYKGQVRFEKLNQEEHEVELVGRGQDVQGKGGAEMRMVSRLRPLEFGETEVIVISDVSLSGRLAQFGRGMIQDISEQVFQQFTAAMRHQLEGRASHRPSAAEGPAAEALNVGSLGIRAMGRSVGRFVSRIFGNSGGSAP